MRIALDLTGLPRVGGARSSALLWADRLASVGGGHEFVVFASEDLISLREHDNVRLIARPMVRRGAIRAWAQWYIPRAVAKLEIDVYHAMKNVSVMGLRCPTVVTVNDLTHVTLAHLDPLPDRMFWARLQPVLLRRASSIIAISQATKSLIVHHYGLSGDRVTVIHPPVDQRYHRVPTTDESCQVLRKHALVGGYFLYVGSLGLHKNVATLLDAHEPIWRRYKRPLVLVTGAEHTRSDLRLLDELKARSAGSGVLHLGYVPDGEMPALYREAQAVVIPSLSEGFGLAAVEAMACGTPVIASDIPALREVVDGSGLFVASPLVPSAFSAAMEQLLDDASLRRVLSMRATERAAGFLKMNTAQQTIAVYERLLGH